MVSAVAIAVAAAVVAVGVLAGIFLLMFMNRCVAPRCSAAGAYTVVGGALLVAAAVAIGGMALSITRLVRRRTAWPFALATLVVCSAVVLLGGVGYFAAVG